MTTRTLRIAVAALTTAAALTLTACGGGSDSGSGQAEDDQQAAATGSPSAAPEPQTLAGDEGGEGGEDNGEAGTTVDDKAGEKGDACGPGAVRIEVKAVSSPAHHVVLVATNTSDAACVAYGFPFLRFDQDQATVGVEEKSRTQGRLTLAPGKSAYAGVLASAADGSGGNGHDAEQISVSFQTPAGEPLSSEPAHPDLPGGTLRVDDTARTTYWQPDEASALKW
ncbi:DUF4232 domain-containing protein [Streptomyces sp. NPDC049555]|uniref:DUF4232 domain-containing protein n=1 Tax=Streptomyces sp. NPDC049555 TaxID=3154930 RepID=UPI003421A83B